MLAFLLACVPEVPILGNEVCAEPRNAFVACTLDGDTFGVDDCEGGERIRLLGIDAPEIEHAPDPADCFGDEAHAYADAVLAKRWVELTFDETCTDVYDRTLAWAFVDVEDDATLAGDAFDLGIIDADDDRILMNELIVRLGYARVYDEGFAQDVRYYDRIVAAATAAEAEGRGLWGTCKSK